MKRRVPKDRTKGRYATAIRYAMGDMSQREVQEELGFGHGSISSLLCGRCFMSQDKVEQLLDYLGFTEKKKKQLIANINYQRQFPVIEKPFLNFRAKALRVIQRKRVVDITNSQLHENTVIQIENGLTTIGPWRQQLLEAALGESINITEKDINSMLSCLHGHTEANILTLAYYLINEYESKTNASGE